MSVYHPGGITRSHAYPLYCPGAGKSTAASTADMGEADLRLMLIAASNPERKSGIASWATRQQRGCRLTLAQAPRIDLANGEAPCTREGLA